MKDKDKTKDKNTLLEMFRKEREIADRTNDIINNKDLAPQELKKEYEFLSQKYSKLLNEVLKITRVGDVSYKKLMAANEHIRRQKNEMETLNRQLREANATKDKFYSIIAHDLRNPLQFLLLSSDLLEDTDGFDDQESIRKFTRKVFRTAKNLSELLENLLQWSQSQSGDIGSRPRSIMLAEQARENIEYFSDIAREKHITLILEIPEETYVAADQDMIRSVFRNLISNALKFTGAGGSIAINAEEKGDTVVCTVIDTGVGIPPKIMKNLFVMGENYPATGTAKEKGSGLGLLLCKEFVEKNDGALTVESKEGEGSTFTFTLRRGEAPE